MASYDIFDEQYYLSQYPWVKPAIDAGTIQSGREHFEKFGQAGGLTKVSRYFDEDTYLAGNPDIAALVRTPSNPNGTFATGLDHFIQFGYEEGRSRVSPDYDERFYLKRYPVLVSFVQNGTFKSGYQHFVKFGAKEGLYVSSFFEPEYLLKNPDVATAVKAGFFKTGGEHYRKLGQFEPTRSATFVGTNDNDIVTGFGVGKVEITGIQVSLDAGGNRVYEKSLFNEKKVSDTDTLIGGQGSDTFILGANDTLLYVSTFGLASGAALIKNFDQQADKIRLAGTRGWYNYPSNDTGKFDIKFGNDGTVARVELVANQQFLKNQGPNFSIFDQVSVLDNFWEAGYLAKNPDVAAVVRSGSFASGLEQYTKVGQFETDRSATFVGTDGNDVVTAFGKGKSTVIGVDFDGRYLSDGSNEFDTLIGSEGADTFILAHSSRGSTSFIARSALLYYGPGEARIRDFNPDRGDTLQLAGTLDYYQISPVGADLVISREGDRIAILEGGAHLNLRQLTFPNADFGNSNPFLLG